MYSSTESFETDGRYYLQAEKQLDSNWTLMKDGMYIMHTACN